jgi:hypothetical protein
MPQVAQGPPPQPYHGALRLTFEYEGSKVKLVSSQRVDMMLPPTQPLEGQQEQSGFWFTVSDNQGKSLYRRVMHNPISIDREVFSNDPQHPSIQRVAVPKPKGTFVLLVPDIQGAQTLHLFSHPLDAKSIGAASEEIARFDLKTPPPKPAEEKK